MFYYDVTMPEELLLVGERIKLLREKTNISQTQLASTFKLSRSTVNSWEMKNSVPSVRYIVELAKLFNVSTDYILGIETSSNISVSGLNQKQILLIYNMIQCFRENNQKVTDT